MTGSELMPQLNREEIMANAPTSEPGMTAEASRLEQILPEPQP
jgi:hypothetical protein